MKGQWVAVAILLEVLSCAGYVVAFLQVFNRAPFRVGARVALSEEAFGAAVSLGGVGSLAVGAWLMVERGSDPSAVRVLRRRRPRPAAGPRGAGVPDWLPVELHPRAGRDRLDGSMIGMLVLYAVSGTIATAATLVYHAIALWVPAVWGTIAFAVLQKTKKQPIVLRNPTEELHPRSR